MNKNFPGLTLADLQAVSDLQVNLRGKKILHLGSLAGWPYTLASTMRCLGLNSENVIHAYRDVDSLERNLPFDRCLYKKNDHLLLKLFRIIRFLVKVPFEYSIVHYHSSNILPREVHFLLEGLFLRILRIPMVLSLGGGDSRLVYITRRYNKLFFRKWYARDPINRLRWFSWSKHINLCATDQELGKIAKLFMQNVVLMRQPVDLSKIKSITDPPTDNQLTIMHVPTQPWKKGSDKILETLYQLQSEGFKINILHDHNLSQAKFYDLLSVADIYIDELYCGAHGVTAVESMASGNITCTYIRDDLVEQYPGDLPIINVNPSNLYEKVKAICLLSSAEIQALKAKSREYAVRYHCSYTVAMSLIDQYNNLLSRAS